MGLVLVSLVGGCEALLASAASGRWARPGVRQGFLAVSTALVVTAAAVASWAAQTGHDGAAGGGHGGAGRGSLAAAVDGSHGHTAGAAGTGGAAGPIAGDVATGHDHSVPADPTNGSPEAGGGHDHSAGAETSGATPADHVHPATGSAAGAAAAAHEHSVPAAGQSGPSAGHDHGGLAVGDGGTSGTGGTGGSGPVPGEGHHHDQGPPPASDAPQGTWAELRDGPFVIPPEQAGGGADHADIAAPSLPKPCSNCFLLQFEPDLVYADGTAANLDTGMMLHHAVLFAAGRQDATCGPEQPFPGQLGQRFFASGNERTPGVFPPGFGYYVDGGNWSGIFHIMNHGAEARAVYFRLKVRSSPAAAGGVLPLTPLWLDMNNCRTSEYAVPAGPSSSHWTWTSNVTGRIVSTGGHVHNGGIRTTLSNTTTGEHLCTSWAGWGRNAAYQGSIESMSVCTWDRVGTVQKGEVLDLESVYDAPQPGPDA